MIDWKKKLDKGEGKLLDKVLTKEEDRRTGRSAPRLVPGVIMNPTGRQSGIESLVCLPTPVQETISIVVVFWLATR